MRTEFRYALRILVFGMLIYISTFAFDFLNMTDDLMVAAGFVILLSEGMFVMWWIRSWFTTLVDESPVVVNPPSEPDNTKKEV